MNRQFTQILKDEAKVIPATEEKVFDKLWVSNLRIMSNPTKTMVVAHLNSYNGEEMLNDPEQIVIKDLFASMEDENIPESLRTKYTQLMELILQTVKEEKEYRASLIEEPTSI